MDILPEGDSISLMVPRTVLVYVSKCLSLLVRHHTRLHAHQVQERDIAHYWSEQNEDELARQKLERQRELEKQQELERKRKEAEFLRQHLWWNEGRKVVKGRFQ